MSSGAARWIGRSVAPGVAIRLAAECSSLLEHPSGRGKNSLSTFHESNTPQFGSTVDSPRSSFRHVEKSARSNANWTQELADLLDQVRSRSEKIVLIAQSRIDITKACDQAKQLAEVGPGWGDGVVPPSAATVDRAVRFVMDLLKWAEQMVVPIAAPMVDAADGASIDLYWKNGMRTLLINVPPVLEGSITFHGHSTSRGTIGGIVKPGARREDIVSWLNQ